MALGFSVRPILLLAVAGLAACAAPSRNISGVWSASATRLDHFATAYVVLSADGDSLTGYVCVYRQGLPGIRGVMIRTALTGEYPRMESQDRTRRIGFIGEHEGDTITGYFVWVNRELSPYRLRFRGPQPQSELPGDCR